MHVEHVLLLYFATAFHEHHYKLYVIVYKKNNPQGSACALNFDIDEVQLQNTRKDGVVSHVHIVWK